MDFKIIAIRFYVVKKKQCKEYVPSLVFTEYRHAYAQVVIGPSVRRLL